MKENKYIIKYDLSNEDMETSPQPSSLLSLKRRANIGFDLNLCVICQQRSKDDPVSEAKGRQQIMAAAEIRRDDVWRRLNSEVIDSVFKYHTNNKCYKAYTHKRRLSTITPEAEDNYSEQMCYRDENPLQLPKNTR